MPTLTEKMLLDVISNISNKYEDIDENELIEEFNGILTLLDENTKTTGGKGKGKNSVVSRENIQDTQVSEETLKSQTVVQLKEILKSKGLKVGGKKQELIDRLLGREEPSNSPTKKAGKKSVSFGNDKRITVKDKRRENNASVVKKLEEISGKQLLKRTEDGILIHTKSQLVFELEEHEHNRRRAIGVRNPNGNVDPLTAKDIETCNLYKFDYILPENLASKNDVNDDIEELDGEEDGVNEDELLASEDGDEESEEELTDIEDE